MLAVWNGYNGFAQCNIAFCVAVEIWREDAQTQQSLNVIAVKLYSHKAVMVGVGRYLPIYGSLQWELNLSH